MKRRKKTRFSISLPSSKLIISLIPIYKHYAIDIADPSSVQDACHMNFVIDLAHRGVSKAQWLEHLRFDSSWGLRIFYLAHAREKTEKKTSFSILRTIGNDCIGAIQEDHSHFQL